MASDSPLAPDFIRFLFSTKPKFDCYFQVGNKSQGKPERIGAVKLMLMAHSEVFRLNLEDSDLKEKGDVPLKDVHPETFRGLLKYVYGHDTTSEMCFDDANNLFYVAETYVIKTLKDKLAVRLMKLLNPDNICSLLNNPACYAHLELNSTITDILRYETDRVLASPQFLWMNADGFLKILKQDGLAVPEIELWRAAIKWAKHRANSDDGKLMRQQLSGLTQHLRLCTLTVDEVCTEVATTKVLTGDEIGAVCQSVGRKEKPRDLHDFSNETEPRKILQRKKTLRRERTVQNELALTELIGFSIISGEYNFTLLTKKGRIELLSLVCRSGDNGKVECTTTITKVVNPNNPDNSSASEPPITVYFSENVKRGEEFEIPLAVDGRNITLLPDAKYTVKMKLNGWHNVYYSRDSDSCGNDHLTLVITPHSYYGDYHFPSTRLQYSVTTVE